MGYAITIIIVSLALSVAWRWPKFRRQELWGAVFTTPVLFLNILLSGNWLRLGLTADDAILSTISTLFALAACGALLAVAYEVTINRWLTPVGTTGRHHLWWLAGGIIVSGLAFLFGAPLLLALTIGLLFDMVFVTFVARELFWDVFLAVCGLAAWFTLADILFGFRTSGDVSALLLGPQSIGLTLAGLPIERLLVMAGVGSLVSPLFVALRGHRFPEVGAVEKNVHGKMIFSAMVTIAGIILATWFTLKYILAPKVLAMSPAIGATTVATNNNLTFQFSLPVDRNLLQLNIQPAVSGSWIFEQPTAFGHAFRSATFVFDDPLPANTTFTGAVSGIHSIWGLSAGDAIISFSTVSDMKLAPSTDIPAVDFLPTISENQNIPVNTNTTETPINVPMNVNVSATNTTTEIIPPTESAPTKVVTLTASVKHQLAVPLDYQDQPLSCEAASLKMALAAQGVKVTEKQIMDIIGYDPTPHKGKVWGNPHQAFVGNIAGKQNSSGYGVYWEPIARAGSHWRPTTILTNGKLIDLTSAIDAGDAVVIWGTLGNAYRDDWKTPDGTSILAWKGEHARTLIGYSGTSASPTSFIINDPVDGRVTWTAAKLDANWASFGRAGVIVQ